MTNRARRGGWRCAPRGEVADDFCQARRGAVHEQREHRAVDRQVTEQLRPVQEEQGQVERDAGDDDDGLGGRTGDDQQAEQDLDRGGEADEGVGAQSQPEQLEQVKGWIAVQELCRDAGQQQLLAERDDDERAADAHAQHEQRQAQLVGGHPAGAVGVGARRQQRQEQRDPEQVERLEDRHRPSQDEAERTERDRREGGAAQLHPGDEPHSDEALGERDREPARHRSQRQRGAEVCVGDGQRQQRDAQVDAEQTRDPRSQAGQRCQQPQLGRRQPQRDDPPHARADDRHRREGEGRRVEQERQVRGERRRVVDEPLGVGEHGVPPGWPPRACYPSAGVADRPSASTGPLRGAGILGVGWMPSSCAAAGP